MRKSIRTLALLLLLALLLVGCAAPAANAPADAPAATTPEQTDTPVETPADEPADAPADEPEEPVEEAPTVHPTGVSAELYYNPEHPYWVADEMQTISFSCNYNSGIDGILTPNDSLMIDELEAATNVHVEWELISNPETYSVMLASGVYCDLIVPMTQYPGGWGKAIEDGITTDVTDIVNSCMPNYRGIINQNPDVYRETHSDEGRNVAIYSVICNDAGVIAPAIQPWGLVIREDWLNDLGLEKPVTIADWDNVLQQFKDQKNASAPLWMPNTGFVISDAFLSAWNCLSTFYVDLDGQTVKYGPMEDGYREYLALMNDWYDRDLFNKDYIGGTYENLINSLHDGTSGAGGISSAQSADWFYRFGFTTDEDYMIGSVEYPVLNEGDTPQRGNFRSYVFTTVVMTADSENKEAAARWLDYMYTYEGMLLINFGVEGEGYFFDDDGILHQSELMLARPENAIYATDSAAIYTLSLLIGLNDTETYNKKLTEPMIEISANFTATSNAMAMPTMLSFTQEESEILAGTYSDIQTYVNEMTGRYITGAASLEEYESFINELTAMRIQDCIDVYQAAYTRYINR